LFAQYIIRNTFSLAKLSLSRKLERWFIYRWKMSHGGSKRNFRMFITPLEFIAAITQHILERLLLMYRCRFSSANPIIISGNLASQYPNKTAGRITPTGCCV